MLLRHTDHIQTTTTSSDYLYELDKITQEVLSRISEYLRDHPGEEGGEVNIDKDLSLSLPPRLVSLSQLQRLRRQFLALSRKHTIARERIKGAFVEHLGEELNAG